MDAVEGTLFWLINQNIYSNPIGGLEKGHLVTIHLRFVLFH